MPQLTIFGDSIAHGGIDNESGGWATRLRLYFMRSGLGDHVFVLGIGGNTSRDVLERFDREIEARLSRTDIITFAVGINDLGGDAPVDEKEFCRNIDMLGKKAVSKGKKVLFLGFTPTTRDQETQRCYNNHIADVCRQNGYFFIGMDNVFEECDLADNVHPKASGHKKICERVIDNLIGFGLLPPRTA